jgi:hypothetical protein
MKHFIITRFNIDYLTRCEHPHLWLYDRMQLFRDYTVPSMQRQTLDDFEWIIRIDPSTPAGIVQQLAKFGHPMIGTDEMVMAYIGSNRWDNEPVITTRLDNDDYVEEGWVEMIQMEALAATQDTVIDTLGRAFDVETGRYFNPGRGGANSMFVSLVEFGAIKGVYSRPHYKIGDDYPTVVIPHFGWVMVCHGGNLMNKILPEFKQNVPQTYYTNE